MPAYVVVRSNSTSSRKHEDHIDAPLSRPHGTNKPKQMPQQIHTDTSSEGVGVDAASELTALFCSLKVSLEPVRIRSKGYNQSLRGHDTDSLQGPLGHRFEVAFSRSLNPTMRFKWARMWPHSCKVLGLLPSPCSSYTWANFDKPFALKYIFLSLVK